jgi:nucleotide-binding universal stress UspA family protein
MWKRILVPLDGSNLAELALAYAEEIAVAFKSELVLLYVNEPKEDQYRHMHKLYMEEVAEGVKERFRKRARVKTVVLSGEPAEEIIKYTEKNDVSVIIMASHGRSGITGWVMGGVASKLLHTAKVPVMLIRTTKLPKREPREKLLERVLLPLDGSEAGEAAVPYVRKLIDKLGSEVILFEVVAGGQHVRTVGGLDYILYPEPEMELAKTEAKEYLDKLSQRLAVKKGKVSVSLKIGDNVAGDIIKFAKRKKVGLIAISAHGHSGIERWVFGSTASKIVQSSKIPVLMVRTPREEA